MKTREYIKNKLITTYPYWGIAPLGIDYPKIAIELTKLGGVGIIDLQGYKTTSSLENVFNIMEKEIPEDKYWGVRITSSNQLQDLKYIDKIPIIILSSTYANKISTEDIKLVNKISEWIIGEVLYLDEAYQCAPWVDFFLVKGNESGGKVGTKTSFILLQEFYESGLPFIAQGGFGIYNVGTAFLANALGVVFDGQLYQLDDCSLDLDVKRYIGSLQENDTYVANESSKYRYRLAGKLANRHIREIKKRTAEEFSQYGEEEKNDVIEDMANNGLFFKDEEIKHAFLPMGVDVTFSTIIKERFKTLKHFLDGINQIIQSQRQNVIKNWPFVQESDLANSLNITLPIIQGPMANISDNVQFATKVAQHGALPIIALGGLMRNETEELFKELKKSTLKNQSYGCGIIGLDAVKKRREEHLELLKELKPAHILIAAGRIGLGEEVKAMGFNVLLHTPALALFREAVEKDIGYPILEGAECGGHIGTTSSFILWEKVLHYLDEVKQDRNKKIPIIFAGGIADKIGSAMLALMLGKHLDIISPGIQMGSGYLLTEEIVSTGALKKKYQELVLNSRNTRVIGTTVNTRIRTIETPFVQVIIDNEIKRIHENIPLKERKELYEKDNLGALRIASRGEIWNHGHVAGSGTTRFIGIDEEDQYQKGCFMAGEITSKKRAITTLKSFHQDIVNAGKNFIDLQNFTSIFEREQLIALEQKEAIPIINAKNKVAIVGVGCIFPDALNKDQYWENILNKRYSIIEVPKNRWDPELYYDSNPETPDKTYTKIGGFINNFKFKTIKYRIPPTISQKMDDVQKWALVAAEQALMDANIPIDGKERLPIAIIVGNSLGGQNQRESNRRIEYPSIIQDIYNSSIFQELDPITQKELIKQFSNNYLSKYPEINEDTMPGELSNIIAGRIANVFNLTGKSMTTDAACASSLASLDTAVKGLLVGDYDTVLVGGADRSMDPTTYVKFCKIGALSPDISAPFDERANGFVMGEGAGFVLLKRLEEAIKNEDKIYAIISAIGATSDGKGKGITAPNPVGQKESIRKALHAADVNLEDIQYIEAHGTSTSVGDPAELEVLTEVFKSRQSKEKIAVGSVKSQIGHLKSAAGIASIIKTTLAIQNKIIPPSVNFENPNPKVNWTNLPFYVNTEAKKWSINSINRRIAGVSAFGFGGTNYHVIMEEYAPETAQYIFTDLVEENYSKKVDLAFLFTGQGSQYVGMAKELAQRYEVVAKTIEQAESICHSHGEFSLKEVLFGKDTSNNKENERILALTQYTQPALFVIEIALYRLYLEKNILPSMVAGHSLGEYSALVAAGVLSFENGLKAVITRGKAMHTVSQSTKGSMAAVLAPEQVVQEIVDEIKDHYVILANYNSSEQIVISGEEEGIDLAIKKAEKRGLRAVKLKVSTAFHSKIVEDAKEEMKHVLSTCTFNLPKIKVYSNTLGKCFPNEVVKIKELLLKQIYSPVRWVEEIKNMYADGARIFVEVGPKRALASFAKDILKDETDVKIFSTLSPNESENKKFLDTVDEIYKTIRKEERRKDHIPIQHQLMSSSAFTILEQDTDLKPIINKKYFNEYLKENKEILKTFLLQGFNLYENKYRKALDLYSKYESYNFNLENIGITGVGMGIPGKKYAVFDDKNVDLLLNGTSLIDTLDYKVKKDQLDQNIQRLVKSANGNAEFQHLDDISQVIQLAGQIGDFDPEKDFGIDRKLLKALDSSFALAICAGLEALNDSKIPLVNANQESSTGKIINSEWTLPTSLRGETGIIFASAFPGYDKLIEEVTTRLAAKFQKQNIAEIEELFEVMIASISDEQSKKNIKKWYEDNKHSLTKQKQELERFSRFFLFRILSMGHSQFAQLIKARGPNTQVNAACASTTQAIAIAEDWIRTGRCKRVIIIAGENAASENLLPWIGSGFLAAGGVTTEEDVEKAALPFGKNRHGLIIGSLAASMILESKEAYETRGIKPIVDLLGTHTSNSAFHGSRLDVNHIAEELDAFIASTERKHGVKREEIAKKGLFVSHETYTPARGGSAEAEIESIERVFREHAIHMTIMNTKGYTGHAMGAGLEECLAIKAMEKGKLPPIYNLDKIDPAFSKFKFSRGEKEQKEYALRLAAGFGSQVAFTLLRLNTAKNRVLAGYNDWLINLGGSRKELYKDGRVLKMKIEQQSTDEITVSSYTQVQRGSILQEVIGIIAEKTGYDVEMIEPEMNLEADLGIDTVKQAELFGIIRERWPFSQDESVSLASFETVNKIAEFIEKNAQNNGIEKNPKDESTRDLSVEVKTIISKHTGYDLEEILDEYNLESDLGVDTIKIAEIFGDIRSNFNLATSQDFNLADFRTIKDIVDYISTNEQDNKVTKEESINVFDIKPIVVPLTSGTNLLDLTGKDITIIAQKQSEITQIEERLKNLKANVSTILYKEMRKDTTITNKPRISVVFVPSNRYIKPTSLFQKLFHFYQSIPIKKHEKIMVISAEAFFGVENHSCAKSGAVNAFVQTLAQEFTLDAKHLYISPGETNKIIEELQTWDEYTEIAYKDGQRYTLGLIKTTVKAEDKNIELSENDIVLVTGGGRGITFESTYQLLLSVQSSPSVALVGRTKLPEDYDMLLSMTEEDLEKEKQKISKELKEKQDKVTPIMIKKEWERLLKKKELAENIQKLQEKNIPVKYYSFDLLNTKKISTLLEEIEQDFKKKISVIIHGAGIEESKQFKQKKLEFSSKIVQIKVDTIDEILRSLPKNQIKYIASFASIAGRFGNRGQVDYAFANGYLSRLSWTLNQRNIRSLAIDWSAWKDIGMATKGNILDILEMQGITAIPTKYGVETFVNLLLHGEKNQPEVVVAGELGAILKQTESKEYQSTQPIFDNIHCNKKNYIATGSISTKSHRYLIDHQIQDVPVFPGVMGIEAFFEAYKEITGESANSITNVDFKSALRIEKDKTQKIMVSTHLLKNKMKLLSVRENDETKHFVTDIPSKIDRPVYSMKDIELSHVNIMNQKEIYSLFFHGPTFQVLDALNTIKQNEIITKVRIDQRIRLKSQSMLLFPLIIEAAFQTAGLYDLLMNEKFSLPSKIAKLTLYSQDNTSLKPSYAIARLKKIEDRHSYYDVEVFNENNQCIVELENFALIHTTIPIPNTNDFKDLFESIQEQTRLNSIFNDRSYKVLPTTSIKENLMNSKDYFQTILSQREQEQYKAIKSEKRKLDYLSGIIAAKELLCREKKGRTFLDFEIRKEQKGRPYVYDLKSKKRLPMHLSISHSNGLAVAMVSDKPVGLDLEKIEERAEAFYREAFTDKEQTLISYNNKKGTQYWTIKEAISKALGEGLHLNLKNIQVDAYKDNYRVTLAPKIKQTHKISDNEIKINSHNTNNYVLTFCEITKEEN